MGRRRRRRRGTGLNPTTVGVVVFPDVQLLDIAGPLDLLATVEGLEVRLIAHELAPVSPVNMPHVSVTPHVTLRDVERVDVLLVPGGQGIATLLESPGALAEIARLGNGATFVTSVCTGALVLGAAGLLRGYRAATYWNYVDLLPLVGAIPSNARVEQDRNRLTSGGVTAGIDFGLQLIALLKDARTAQKQQLQLQYDPHPPFSAGNEQTAPPDVVAELRAAMRPTHEQRETLLRSGLQAH